MRPGVRIGVDVGSVRIGVARTDPSGLVGVPVETVPRGEGDLGGRWQDGQKYDDRFMNATRRMAAPQRSQASPSRP